MRLFEIQAFSWLCLYTERQNNRVVVLKVSKNHPVEGKSTIVSCTRRSATFEAKYIGLFFQNNEAKKRGEASQYMQSDFRKIAEYILQDLPADIKHQ